jgi:predicted NAD-dependent protein-ADP-ribosyltransferase YbiA (DUF1768 family)
MTGKLIFASIPKLPDNWWNGTPQDNPGVVWNYWNSNSFYLWGANSGNYQQKSIGTIIGGGGMAGTHGPSLGRYHPHYVGVNTMEINHMKDNDAVFDDLNDKIKNGQNVVVPIFPDGNDFKYSLGTGIGSDVPNWGDIQKYVFEKILMLADTAGQTNIEIPTGVYWPDCQQTEPYPRYPITDMGDIKTIIKEHLSGNSKPLVSVESSEVVSKKFSPKPSKAIINGNTYGLVAFYYPGKIKPHSVDDIYQAYYLGNFYQTEVKITVNNITGVFKTSEAAFQATKWWADDSIRQQFENAIDGNEAFHLSQKYENSADPNYAGLGREGSMDLVLLSKFSNPELQQGLLDTGNSYLLEHNDKPQGGFWSDHHDGTGKNKLGLTLMKTREHFGGSPSPCNTCEVKDFTMQVKTS